jgi:hypothetical protein
MAQAFRGNVNLMKVERGLDREVITLPQVTRLSWMDVTFSNRNLMN